MFLSSQGNWEIPTLLCGHDTIVFYTIVLSIWDTLSNKIILLKYTKVLKKVLERSEKNFEDEKL